MSDNDFPVVRLSWFSVVLRFFTPDIDPFCHVDNWTVRAATAERAIEIVREFIDGQYFDPTSRRHFLPSGMLVDLWYYDAREVPPERAALLEQNTTPDESLPIGPPAPEAVGGDNVIDLFSRRKKPAPENDPTHGGDTPPRGTPPDHTKP